MLAGCASPGTTSSGASTPTTTSSGQPSSSLAGKWALAHRLANTTDDSYYLEIKETGEAVAHGNSGAYLGEPYVDGCLGKVAATDQPGQFELAMNCLGNNTYFPNGPSPRPYKARADIKEPDDTSRKTCESLEMDATRGVLILDYPASGRGDLLCRRN
jgi:hypothetical protein